MMRASTAAGPDAPACDVASMRLEIAAVGEEAVVEFVFQAMRLGIEARENARHRTGKLAVCGIDLLGHGRHAFDELGTRARGLGFHRRRVAEGSWCLWIVSPAGSVLERDEGIDCRAHVAVVGRAVGLVDAVQPERGGNPRPR